MKRDRVTDESIRILVHAFYEKVRIERLTGIGGEPGGEPRRLQSTRYR